jgi:hypothetical protein
MKGLRDRHSATAHCSRHCESLGTALGLLFRLPLWNGCEDVALRAKTVARLRQSGRAGMPV